MFVKRRKVKENKKGGKGNRRIYGLKYLGISYQYQLW